VTIPKNFSKIDKNKLYIDSYGEKCGNATHHILSKSYFVFVKINLKFISDIKTHYYIGETKKKIIRYNPYLIIVGWFAKMEHE